MGEDDGEVQSGEDDEESDARDEDSKSEGGDESGGEDREGSAMRELRLSMASQAPAQQTFNLQRRSTGQYFAQELPILESKESSSN